MNPFGENCLQYANGFAGTLNVAGASYGPTGRNARIAYSLLPCHCGQILIAATARGVCWLGVHENAAYLESEMRRDFPRAAIFHDGDSVQEFATQAISFISGSHAPLHLALDIRATPFQLAVWRELCAIPPGETRSYGEIARSLGQSAGARAVGHANASNPLAILIPCHRVVGANGKLTGYRWGLEYKRRLLEYERANGL